MNECKIVIRLVKEEDLDDLAFLYAQIYNNIEIGEEWTKEKAFELLNYWYLKQPDLFFVAISGSIIVGAFVAGIKPWWNGNHLIDGEIFVDVNYRGRGIGSKLSKIMYDMALKKYQIASIDFTTYSKDGFPLSWYEKLGFEKNKILKIIEGKPKNVLKNLGK